MRYPSLAAFQPVDVMRLIRSENVGAVTFFHLLNRYGSVTAALDALPELARRGGRQRPLRIASKSQTETELEKAEKFGARILLYGQPDYPMLLHEIHDAPPLLMLRGQPVWNHKRTLGIVGSRNASASGCSLTRKLARDCGEMGYSIVSGLARGIDAAAHQSALPTGTVGVIAGGIDNIYPQENRPLYDQMAESGAILSEQPFGSAPIARSFPGRNRIIAGMCEAVLVVEATQKSGSLITAEYALEQGREVLAIPGSPLDPRSHGPNHLIKQGAALIQSAEDIFRATQQPAAVNALAEAETVQFLSSPPRQPDAHTLDEARTTLLNKLSPTPISLDAIARETGIPVNLLQSIVLELELAGRVSRSPGGRICLVYEDNQNQKESLAQAALVV